MSGVLYVAIGTGSMVAGLLLGAAIDWLLSHLRLYARVMGALFPGAHDETTRPAARPVAPRSGSSLTLGPEGEAGPRVAGGAAAGHEGDRPAARTLTDAEAERLIALCQIPSDAGGTSLSIERAWGEAIS